MIEALGSGKPIEIRAPSPKGPKVTQEDIDRWNEAANATNGLSEKVESLIKETEDLDKIRGYIKEIQAKIGDFVTNDEYQKTCNEVRNLGEQAKYTKEDLEALTREVEKIKDMLAKMNFPSMDDFNLMRGR